MLGKYTPSAIFRNTILSFSVFYFLWCAKSGGELNRSLGKDVAISAWWFLLPFFGAYWWAWNFCNALEQYSKKYIKQADAFLVFIIASFAPQALLSLIDVVDLLSTILPNDEGQVVIYASMVLTPLAILIGAAIFPAYIESKFQAGSKK